ncbi:MAG: septum site-determining protein MinC [Chromatiales bacterium]|nr:septum site-determining protein MinC [Chromatiales bacterium]
MSRSPKKAASEAAFDFRGSMFTLPSLRLHTTDLAVLRDELERKCEQAPAFFVGAPVVIELGALGDGAIGLDFDGLGDLLRDCGIVPVGVREADDDTRAKARDAGFAVMQGGGKPVREVATEKSAGRKPAKIVHGSVRSGQLVHADGGDLIVLGAVNEGAEVVADGHVHIYGSLRGRARAGARGDTDALIFTLGLAPEVVAIADQYLVIEEPDPQLTGKPGLVSLRDGTLTLQPI